MLQQSCRIGLCTKHNFGCFFLFLNIPFTFKFNISLFFVKFFSQKTKTSFISSSSPEQGLFGVDELRHRRSRTMQQTATAFNAVEQRCSALQSSAVHHAAAAELCSAKFCCGSSAAQSPWTRCRTEFQVSSKTQRRPQKDPPQNWVFVA